MKFELKETEHGPTLIAGDKFVLNSSYSINQCNKYLRSLNTGLEIKFENFNQYISLLRKIADKLGLLFIIA